MADVVDAIFFRHDELDEGTSTPVIFPENIGESQFAGETGRVVPVLLWTVRVPPPDHGVGHFQNAF